VSSTHGEQQVARRAYLRIARFFASLRAKAEQLDAVQRWYRILARHCENICAAPDPACAPAAGLTPPATVANRDANCRRAWSQLPDLGLKATGWPIKSACREV
jgi:hypothetical protein